MARRIPQGAYERVLNYRNDPASRTPLAQRKRAAQPVVPMPIAEAAGHLFEGFSFSFFAFFLGVAVAIVLRVLGVA